MRDMLGLNQDLVLATTFAEMWVDRQIADELSWIKAGTRKTPCKAEPSNSTCGC